MLWFFTLNCTADILLFFVKSHCQLITELSLMSAMLVEAFDEDSLKLYSYLVKNNGMPNGAFNHRAGWDVNSSQTIIFL